MARCDPQKIGSASFTNPVECKYVLNTTSLKVQNYIGMENYL